MDRKKETNSFVQRLEAVRNANAELHLGSPNAYKNGQISENESGSMWDNFDRFFKFYNIAP